MTSYNKHYVFVYGSLKSGFANNHVMSTTWRRSEIGAEKYGEGITLRQDMTMVPLTLFPGVIEGGGKQAIWGEVWHVGDELLERLDAMERVPTYYRRIETDIVLDDGELVKAYMYVLSDMVAKRVTDPAAQRLYESRHNRIELHNIEGVTVANWAPSDWEKERK